MKKEIIDRVKLLDEVLNNGYGVPNTDWVKNAVKELKELVLRQPDVSGTFCEKCDPNGVVDGNIVRCKKCGRGLAFIEQNYH
jgi:hypothetical protein